MSVEVIATPNAFSWAKNRNSYKLQCSYLDTTGSTGTFYIIRAGDLPAVGHHVVFAVDGMELVFTVVASQSNNTYEVYSSNELFDKIRACRYVQQLFYFPPNFIDATHLVFVSRAVGFHKVEVFCTDADGVKTNHTIVSWMLGSNGAGVDRKEKPNYAIAAEMEVLVNNNNSVTTHKVGGLVFQPNGNGIVEIPLDLLEGFIPQPDQLPVDFGSSSWAILTNALLKYRVSWGEMWGSPAPLIQNWATQGYKYAFCGEEAERFAGLNVPDWDSQLNTSTFSRQNSDFWVIGEGNNQVVRVCESQAEYIYGFWYDPTQAATATLTVGMKVNNTQVNHTVKNGEVYRIPVGPLVLSQSGHSYTVELIVGELSWLRRYDVVPDYFEPTYFAMQNKYGLLWSFVVPEVKREITTEGDALKVDRRRYLDIKENFETYRAVTAYLTKEEGRRLAMCIGQQYQYVYHGNSWLRITVEPGSFVVVDESADMVKVEFSYRFVENQVETITNSGMQSNSVFNIIDFNNQLIISTGRTNPSRNELLYAD